MVNGSETKTAITTIHGFAVEGSPSQSLGPLISPRSVIAVFRTPAVRSSIHLKPMEVISTDAAHGAISAQRVRRRPGNCWLNSCARASGTSCARASEITMVSATTATVQITVQASTL